MSTSDQEINRGVRGVLSRHWVDLSSTSFVSRRGIVRVTGELRRMGAHSQRALESTNLTVLDAELNRLRGVRRVHFDLLNWRRGEDGEWVRVGRQAEESERGKADADSADRARGGADDEATKD